VSELLFIIYLIFSSIVSFDPDLCTLSTWDSLILILRGEAAVFLRPKNPDLYGLEICSEQTEFLLVVACER